MYAEIFPEALYEYDNLFSKMVVIADSDTMVPPDPADWIRKSFQVGSLNRVSLTGMDAREVQESDKTVVVLYTSKNANEIENLAAALPSIQPYKKELLQTKGEFIFSFLDERGRAFVFVKVLAKERLEEAFRRLKSLGRIQVPPQPIWL